MRKRGVSFIACLLALGICSAANAHVFINYVTPVNSLWDNWSVALLASRVVATYWTPDQSTSGFTNADPLNPTGGDSLFGVYNTSSGPPIAGRITGLTPEYGSGSTGYANPGYTYLVVFDMAWSSYAGSIPVGTYYGLAAVSGALTEQHPPPLGTADQYGGTITSLTTNLRTVPEPGTVSLMLMGLGIVAYRRFRRKE